MGFVRQQVGDDLSKKWMDNEYFRQFPIIIISSASFKKGGWARSGCSVFPIGSWKECTRVLNRQRDLMNLEVEPLQSPLSTFNFGNQLVHDLLPDRHAAEMKL